MIKDNIYYFADSSGRKRSTHPFPTKNSDREGLLESYKKLIICAAFTQLIHHFLFSKSTRETQIFLKMYIFFELYQKIYLKVHFCGEIFSINLIYNGKNFFVFFFRSFNSLYSSFYGKSILATNSLVKYAKNDDGGWIL